MKSIGGYFRFIFLVVFFWFLFIPATILSQIVPSRDVGTRVDTVFEQRVIDGKLTTVRRIIIYDSVKIVPKLNYRKSAFDLSTKPPKPISYISQNPTHIKIPPNNNLQQFSTEIGVSSTLWYKTVQPQYPDLGLLSPVYQVERVTEPLLTTGLYVNSFYNWGSWYVRTGTSLQTGKQNALIKSTSIYVDSTMVFNPIQYDTAIIDTVRVLDITQLPDTVYVTLIDTFTQTINDTLVHTSYDSSRVTEQYKLTNRYFYIEIPLMVGYDFDIGKSKLSLEAGVLFTSLTRVRLRLSSQNHSIRQLSDKYAHTINLDGGGRISWRFPVLDSRYIRFSAGIRYGIVNLYQNHNYHIHQKMRWSFAIGYFFN